MDLMDVSPSKSIDAAFARTQYREQRYEHLIRAAVLGWTLTADERKWLSAIFGLRFGSAHAIADRPLMSDLRLRRFATQTLTDLMLAHWRARLPGRRYYSLTLYDEIGVSLDRAPLVALAGFKAQVDKAIRTSPLSALMQIEVQAVTNYPGRHRGRALLFHAHGIGWTNDPAWSAHPVKCANDWADARNASTAWSSEMGGAPVEAKHVGASEADIADVCVYITKVPYNAKFRRPADDGHPKPRLFDTKDVPVDLILRVGEGLSQIAYADGIFSINAPGDSDRTGRAWRKAVLDWHRQRLARRTPVHVGDPAFLAKQWAIIRASNASAHFRKPFAFLPRGVRPPSIHRLHDAALHNL